MYINGSGMISMRRFYWERISSQFICKLGIKDLKSKLGLLFKKYLIKNIKYFRKKYY